MQQYLRLLHDVYLNGDRRETRNAVTYSVFDRSMKFDLRYEFPLLTTKEIRYDIIVGELLSFLRGYDNIEDFRKLGAAGIWEKNQRAWDDESGDMGRIYGVQWRRWRTHHSILKPDPQGGPFLIDGHEEVDQIAQLIDGLMNDPFGRRHVVSAWNPGELDQMCLPPCHMFFQCYVREGALCDYLDMKMYQRSADLFLGVPFNMASYATLLHILAEVCGYNPGRLTMDFGDVHIYEAHIEQVKEQLGRRPIAVKPTMTMKLPGAIPSNHYEALDMIERLEPKDFVIENYLPHPRIKAEMIV